ncbi:MAG: hypothetical protein HQ548_05465, partial [Chloroflexi bacterium]|nr:hypothetical protein [Chloroflexota bacterium]
LSPFQLSPFQLSPFQLSPWQLSPFQLSPFQLSPFQLSPFQLSPYQLSPWQLSPWQLSPFQLSPFQLSPFQLSPLSTMSFIGVEGDEISGTDIDFAELGLGGLAAAGVKIAGFSANRGLEDEAVLVRVDAAGTQVFAVVIGSNDAHSLAPYALQIETSVPFDQVVLASDLDLGQEDAFAQLCGGDPLVPQPQALNVLHDNASPLTLLVTQRERMVALYGQAAWDDLLVQLHALSADPAVEGKVISLPSGIYDEWDSNQCSIEDVNDLAADIRAVIESELQSNPGIQYVVIAGSDDIVPFRRVPDETVISNERYYLMGSFLQPGSPLFSSVMQGFNLTDDFYVDREPTPWQGRALYVPDLPIGRLVETPEEIAAAAQTFLDYQGALDPQTGFVSGYDFFADGSQAMAAALAAKVPVETLINDHWSAGDLLCELLGEGEGADCGSHDISAPNAHFTSYAGLSAGGFSGAGGLDNTDYFTSVQVAEAGGPEAPTPLNGGIVFTMGCHAGLSVPDGSALPADPGLGIDPALDFAQAMAIQRAVYIASTGYGLGDDAGLGGTELLLALFAEELAGHNAAVGPALARAKRRYLNSLSAMTVYDEKSSIQTTLYGLPMYLAGPMEGSVDVQDDSGTPLTLTIMDPDGTAGGATTIYLDEIVTDDGTYYAADGDTQVTAGRPIQPRVVVEDITGGDEDPVYGVLITSSQYITATSTDPGFDPVISRPTMEWEQNPTEPQTCLPSLWPSKLATVNTLDMPGG